MKNDLVLCNIHAVDMKFGDIGNRRLAWIQRVVSVIVNIYVAWVKCLMYRLVHIEMLHYVDFAIVRPPLVGLERHHPDRRPRTLCLCHTGTYLDTAGADRFLTGGVEASAQIVARVSILVVIHNSIEHNRASALLIATVVGALIFFPVGGTLCDAAPYTFVDSLAVKFVLPYQLPTRLLIIVGDYIFIVATATGEQHERQQWHWHHYFLFHGINKVLSY